MNPEDKIPEASTPTEQQIDTGTEVTTQTPVGVTDTAPRKGIRIGKKTVAMPVLVIAILATLLVGSAAAYFGFVLPNKPENIWAKALDNTARGYDRLIDYTEEQKDIKGSKFKGSLKIEGTFAADGNIEGESFEKKSKMKADLGFSGTRINMELRAITPDNATNPDLYLKLDGVQGFGDIAAATGYGDLGPVINGLEDQWIFVDHTLLDQYTQSAEAEGMPELSAEDTVKIAETIGKVNRE